MAGGKYYVYIQRVTTKRGKEVLYTGYTSKTPSIRTEQHSSMEKGKRELSVKIQTNKKIKKRNNNTKFKKRVRSQIQS